MSPIVAPGTPIAVVAPSHAYDAAKLEAGLAIARAHGHVLVPFEGMCRPHRYFAADDDARLAHLTTALTSPDYGAVWVVRGGSGLTRLLPRLPWERLPERPVIGFSDATALLAALHARVGGGLVHGPVLHSLAATDDESVAHLFALLAGSGGGVTGETWVSGAAEGRLVGGNLCVLAALCGTPHQLDATDAILVLEEIGEAPYRVDRLLQQLAASGVLRGVRGIVLGEFTGCEPPAGAGFTLRDVLLEHLAPLGVPVIGDAPIGHGARNRAFPFGARAVLADGGVRWGDYRR